MREYKFRGKTKATGEWVYGDLLHVDNRMCIIPNINVDDIDVGKLEVDPETVGQYTELPDRNNEPLFEGDIIKSIYTSKLYFIAWGDNKDRQPAGFVKIPINHYTSNIELSYIDARAFEKIGNRWDNPELLKEVE